MSMSIDSVFVHKMWDDHELSKMVDGGVPFPMLSDTGGKVGKLYGVFNEAAGVENRGRFIIDPDGVVQGYEVLTPAGGTERSRDLPPGPGLPAGSGKQGQRGHPVRLAAGEGDPQARPRPGGQGVGSVENEHGL
jgi:hypothetical protein